MSTNITDLVRLEVERPRGANELINLIPNPSGDLGAWGWLTPTAGSVLRSVTVSGVRHLRLTSPAGASPIFSETADVAAGRHVAIGLLVQQVSGTATLRVEWINAAGAIISTTADSAFLVASSTRQVFGTYQAPANTVKARLRINPLASGGGTPPAGHTMTFRDVTMTDAATATALRQVRTNMLLNPSFETGTAGWLSGAGVTITSSTSAAVVGSRSLLATRTSTGPLVAYTSALDVIGGRDYVFAARVRPGSTRRTAQLCVRWLNAANARIGDDVVINSIAEPAGWSGLAAARATAPASAARVHFLVKWGNTVAGEGHFLDSAIIEQVRADQPWQGYFDGSTAAAGGVTYAWTGTAHASTSTATSGAADSGPVSPVLYQNILGSATQVSINRADMEPGQLAVTLRDPALDPSNNPLLRPGRRVRLITESGLGQFAGEVIAAGKIAPDSIDVTYEPLRKNPAKRTVISFTTHDSLAALASVSRPEGVASIDELPYVLEGCGVPWSCNGSGDQVANPPIVAYNSSAMALDQVVVTRDTARGYAWIDRNGVVQVWDRAQVPTDQKATLTESVYSPDFASGFDPNSCVNIVEVVALAVVATTGAVEEVRYGPYRDEASILANGEHPGAYTVQGAWNEASASAYAAAILTSSANPRRRVREASVAITSTDRLPLAILDLQDRVHVQNANAGIAEVSRVTTVKHTLTPGKWLMTLGFAGESVAATPVVVKSPPPAAAAVKADVDVDVQAVETVALAAQGTATSAATAAATAQTTADNAQVAADNAVTFAAGKSKTTFSASTPGSTANTAGDLWFQTASGVVLTQWQGNGGTSWTERKVSGTALAADAVDGKVITGATLRTAASGERVIVRNDGSGGVVEAFSGLPNEVLPSVIDPSVTGGENLPTIQVATGTTSTVTERASITVKSGRPYDAGNTADRSSIFGTAMSVIWQATHGRLQLRALLDKITLQSPDEVWVQAPTLRLDGVISTGGVGNGTFRDSVADVSSSRFGGGEGVSFGRSPPAGTLKRVVEGTVIVTTGASGTWAIPLPGGAWSGIQAPLINPGDSASNLGFVRLTAGTFTSTSIRGVAYTPTGVLLASGLNIRLNFRLTGW